MGQAYYPNLEGNSSSSANETQGRQYYSDQEYSSRDRSRRPTRHHSGGGSGGGQSGGRRGPAAAPLAPVATPPGIAFRGRGSHLGKSDPEFLGKNSNLTPFHGIPGSPPGGHHPLPPPGVHPQPIPHPQAPQQPQAMPKSESWDAATTVTGTSATSSEQAAAAAAAAAGYYLDAAYAMDEKPPFWDRCFPPFVSSIAVVVTMATPVLFALLPPLLWEQAQCNNLCNSLYLTLSCKLVVLSVGCWGLHLRRPRAHLPCNSIVRTFILMLLATMLLCFWTFYTVRLLQESSVRDDRVGYETVLQATNTVTDTLLFFHYLAFILLEICQLKTEFILKVVRNTDGESKFYSVGRLSIQNCATWILQNYCKDFPVYNPYLLKAPTKQQQQGACKYQVYDIDGTSINSSLNGSNSILSNSRAIMAASARRRESSRNERFYEEQEFEVKVAKRKARLIVAAEEAFGHLQRTDGYDTPALFSLSARDAAVAIWPSMARALLKYLRVTRQTHIYKQSDLLEHLQNCITLNFTPRAFLEKYLKPEPVITEENASITWELVSNYIPNRLVQEGMVFQLKQEALSLIVYVARVPAFHITEKPGSVAGGGDKFVLSLHDTNV